MIERVIVKLTARIWNRLIASTLCQMYGTGAISSHQLHAIAHEFDPTQSGRVGRIVENGANQQYADSVLRMRSNA